MAKKVVCFYASQCTLMTNLLAHISRRLLRFSR